MTWAPLFSQLGLTIATARELRSAGATEKALTRAVRSRELIRVRRDRYALPGTDRHILRAVRVGGRITCDTALRHYGVFGFDGAVTHIHLDRAASRLRSPGVARAPFAPPVDGVRTHWYPLTEPRAGSEFSVGLVDALACVLRCAEPQHAVAALDNALFLRLITERDLDTVFAAVPDRLQRLRGRIDSRSEAGQETVLRLGFEDAGMEPSIQVSIPSVGRVDLVLEDRLIVEADSMLAHDGWDRHVRDRDRDLAAARLGYMTLRPTSHRTLQRTSEVIAAAAALLAATRGRRRRR